VSTEEIVYGESVRAIEEQESVLDSLRSRTATLLAAAALSTSFLGGQALSRNSNAPVDAVEWLALAAFVAAGGLCILILLPWSWRYSVSARTLLEDHVDVVERSSARQLHRFLALTHEANLRANQAKVDRLGSFFRLASVSLALEVIAWILDLSR
jgi:hypothetical protein